MNGKHDLKGSYWELVQTDLLVFMDDVMSIDFSFLDPSRRPAEL